MAAAFPQETGMSIRKTEPPWEFLLSASKISLQSYELSRLSHAANLRKEIGQLLDSWLEENSAAMLARWLLENRGCQARSADSPPSAEAPAAGQSHGPDTASDNFLADASSSVPVIRGAP
jgi:hypothetical protein